MNLLIIALASVMDWFIFSRKTQSHPLLHRKLLTIPEEQMLISYVGVSKSSVGVSNKSYIGDS